MQRTVGPMRVKLKKETNEMRQKGEDTTNLI
jgi:hypothetical protein